MNDDFYLIGLIYWRYIEASCGWRTFALLCSWILVDECFCNLLLLLFLLLLIENGAISLTEELLLHDDGIGLIGCFMFALRVICDIYIGLYIILS